MASFALVEDHRNTGLYPGKVGCVSVNASAHRFPGGDLRVSSSVFARLRSRRRDGVETCSRPRGRAAAAPPTRPPPGWVEHNEELVSAQAASARRIGLNRMVVAAVVVPRS